MSLINFSLTPPSIEPGVVLSCLETVISQDKIAQAISLSQSQHQRKRSLPTHLVVALVMAMSFWATDSIVDVFKNLIAGLSGSWIRQHIRLKTPTRSSKA